MDSPLDDANDGAADQPAIRNKVWQPAMGKEAFQSPITTIQKRIQQSNPKQSDKKAATATSKPAQGNIPSSKKSARNSSAKRVSLQALPKAERNSRAQREDSSPDSPSVASSENSDEDEPVPKKSALKSTTNKSDGKPPANKSAPKPTANKPGRKPNIKMPLRNSTPKKDRKETVVDGFGCITLGAWRWALQGYSRIQFTGFSDKVASKLGNEIAQFVGGKGVRKERQWGLGYEFQLRGDPWAGRKTFAETYTAMEFTGRTFGDGGAAKEDIFLRHMFGVMHRNGYSLQLSNQNVGYSSFFFKKSPSLAKGTAELMTISFHEPNRLRLTCAPEEFLDAVEGLLQEHPRFKGERKKTQKIKEGKPKSAEYKVLGAVWQPWHTWYRWAPEKRMKITKARVIRLQLMNLLEDQGWKPITSTDKSLTSEGGEIDHVGNTWYYYRDRNTIKEKGLEFESSEPQKAGVWSKIAGQSV
jgi:hypothetical protein